MNAPVIVFDLDDTLLDTGPCFNDAIDEFIEGVREHFHGVYEAEEIRRVQEETDVPSQAGGGFDATRFPKSFVATYRHFCRERKIEPDIASEKRWYKLGWDAFNKVPDIYEDALHVLESLRGRADLRLYTLGVEETQSAKIRAHGLDRIFSRTHIVSRKDAAALQAMTSDAAPSSIAVVGDSIRYEINPALELGYFAIHIRKENPWKHMIVPPVSEEYHEAENLTQARAILEERFLAPGLLPAAGGEA